MKTMRRAKERSEECDGGVLPFRSESLRSSPLHFRTPPSAVRSDRVSEWPPDRTSESPPDPEVSEKAHGHQEDAGDPHEETIVFEIGPSIKHLTELLSEQPCRLHRRGLRSRRPPLHLRKTSLEVPG